MTKVRTATITASVLLGLAWLSPTPAVSASGSADTQAPTTPTNLRITDTTANTARLAWDPSTDDAGTVRYRLRQDGYLVFDGTLTETRAFIYGLRAGGFSFGFEVRAEDSSGNVSAWSAPVTVVTDPPDTTAPTAPTNLRVTRTTSSSVSLAWDASSDNPGGEGIGGYWVQWDGGTTHGTGATSYTWPVLSRGTHRFTVVAYDAAVPSNTSAPSNVATVTNP